MCSGACVSRFPTVQDSLYSPDIKALSLLHSYFCSGTTTPRASSVTPVVGYSFLNDGKYHGLLLLYKYAKSVERFGLLLGYY